MTSPPSQLLVHLSSWIIQDGNYADFQRGQKSCFALELFLDRDRKPLNSDSTFQNTLELKDEKEGFYKAVGEVIYLDDDWIAFDFTLRAYVKRGYFPTTKIGDKFVLRTKFGIDPFFYFEDLSKRPRAPELIYSWHVDKICREAAPFIKEGRIHRRDASKLSWQEISKTDAWKDDDGHADYLFQCSLVDRQPKRTLA